MRASIRCEKCGHPETEIVAPQVHLAPNREGQRVHRQTVDTLRCASAACRHCFETVVAAEKPIP